MPPDKIVPGPPGGRQVSKNAVKSMSAVIAGLLSSGALSACERG
ncbi:hypothetical protein ACH49O_30655 [Streptomyces coeruleorubidus]